MMPAKNRVVKPTTITLPWPPAALSPNTRSHWRVLARAKKLYREECAKQAQAQGLRRIEDQALHLAVTFHPPSRRRMDLDNLIGRMKAGFDGLADVLGVDDSKWSMSFERTDQLAGLVAITFTTPTTQDPQP